MAKLTEPQKLFVVQALATFRTPTEVQKLLDELGVKAEVNQIVRYDPTTAAGDALSQTLRDAFKAARKTFIEDREGIAIAHANWRLRELLELYRESRQSKNRGMAAKLLEQAAKECGERRDGRDKRDARDEVEVPEGPKQDLSRLTSDELSTLEILVTKAAIEGGDTGREGS